MKVDLLAWNPDELRAIAERLRGRGVSLLAERVETEQALALATGLGFSLFQGYYFSRPEMIAHAGTAIETLRLLPLLNVVQDESIANAEVEERIRRDPVLSYKLLRIVNSAAHGGRGIESILHAINLIGRQSLFRWLGLLLTSSLAASGGTSREIVGATLVRARLLELLAPGARANAGALFLTGMFSNMATLLQIPMAELVDRVHFAPEVRSALLRDPSSPYLPWLLLAEAYESGRWQEVAALAERVGVAAGGIADRYLEALQWTSLALGEIEADSAPASRR